MPKKKPHPDAIPAHHMQWFEELKKACFNGDLALLSCKDADTDEPRSVLCAVHQEAGEFVFTPFGHLCPKDNPFEAYTPPEA